MHTLSIIIPVLNESCSIERCLLLLQALRGPALEIIVVDGGSMDETIAVARKYADQVIEYTRGRAPQMNAGARAGHGDTLVFLHADTQLSAENIRELQAAKAACHCLWGYFRLRLSGRGPCFRIIEQCITARSRLSGIATGDQTIFVSRALFFAAGSYAEIPLMEDIALCKKLKQVSKPVCLNSHVVTSSRRWETRGIVPTLLLMWRLRLAYFLGANPQELARQYYA